MVSFSSKSLCHNSREFNILLPSEANVFCVILGHVYIK